MRGKKEQARGVMGHRKPKNKSRLFVCMASLQQRAPMVSIKTAPFAARTRQ